MGIILNLGGLVLGIIAAVIPVYALTKQKYRKADTLIFVSFTACVLALLTQVAAVQQRVALGDTPGIIDTADVVAGASVLLGAAVIVLNFFLFRAREAYKIKKYARSGRSSKSEEKPVNEERA